MTSELFLRWSSYYPECSGVIFVVDISDVGFYPTALVLLYEVLEALFRNGEGIILFVLAQNMFQFASGSRKLQAFTYCVE